MDITRRDMLRLGGAAIAAASRLDPEPAAAQTPKRGRVFRIRGEDAASGFDPHLAEMIRLQRRTFDVTKRREIVYDIQRYLAEQMYYHYDPSVSTVSAWEPYVKNFGPNIGHDYGGRLMVAWLDK